MTHSYIGADPDRLDAFSQELFGHAQLLDTLRETTTAQLLNSSWSGPDAETAHAEWETQHAPAMGTVAALLRQMSTALAANANQQRATSAADIGATPPVGTFGTVGSTGKDDRRGSDERGGRRLRNDEIFRRSEGGDRGGDHFSNDWAGRAILERYLRGGDDWTITDDEEWTSYMTNNQSLRDQLTGPAQEQAQTALQNYLNGQGNQGTFDTTFHAEIENGEGIVGYQYLHGTNSDAGDFRYQGNTVVTPRGDGTYEVVLNSGYTWNDTIDPNPQYSTDQWKSWVAEVVTVGAADPYDIHITWHSQTTVIMDANGNVIGIEGYPAP